MASTAHTVVPGADGAGRVAHAPAPAASSTHAAHEAAWVEAPPSLSRRIVDELASAPARFGSAFPLAARLAWREWRQRASWLAIATPVLLVAAHAGVLAWLFGAGGMLADPVRAAQRLACGALLYSILQQGLARGACVLVEERALVARRSFPLEALLLRPVLAQAIPAGAGLLLLVAWLAAAGTLGAQAFWLPCVVAAFVAFASALAALLACLHARHRGAAELLAWALPLATLATPVWWDESWARPEGFIQAALAWNPLAAFVGAARAACGLGTPDHAHAGMIALWTACSLVAAACVLAWRRPHLADEV